MELTTDTKPKVTPKDFFLWASAMVTLYASVFALIALIFSYVDYAFPDPLLFQYNGDPYSGSIRFALASLIVLAPTFLVLMRLIRRDIAAHPEKEHLWIRRWALYFTLFVAGATVVGDLITLLNYFLDGDLTTRFLLKVLAILLIAGGFFLHFLADLRGYWIAEYTKAMWVNLGAGAVVVIAIGAGFFIIGSPLDAREYRFDRQRVADLQNIQWQIVNYWQQKEKLPGSLTELEDSISGFIPPKDPSTGQPYKYRTTGTLSFELCAIFSRESDNLNYEVTSKPRALDEGNWNHISGEECFDRVIDPERYPPYPTEPFN